METKWEYKIVSYIGYYKSEFAEKLMNRFGNQGWEIVSVHTQLGFFVTHTFKRPKS